MSALSLLALLALPLSVAACVAVITYLLGFDNGYLRALRELRETGARLAGEFRKGVIGTIRPALWESDARTTGSPSVGLTDTYLRVRRANSDGPVDLENVIEQVRLVRLDGDVLVGEPLE